MKRFSAQCIVSVMALALLMISCSPFDYGYIEHEQVNKPKPKPEQTIEEEAVFIPVISIDVKDGKPIESKDEYQKVTVTIEESEYIVYSATGRAKGRGNATWGYEKKPYKIKLDEKLGVLGLAGNKEWVLLAEYCDKSLMRTAYMFELARTVGLPYTNHYRHVQLYLNGEYAGMYLLTEQIEKKGNRVDIEDDGFLFENDNYFWEEALFFNTEIKGYWYTFKYPDAGDEEIVWGDKNFNFINGFLNDFEAALYGENFKDPDNGYRKYIDIKTFVKWYLVQELIANLEPNIYYVLPSRDAKLQIGPVWDAEWCLGLAYRENEYSEWEGYPAQPDKEQAIWSRWKYFGRLFEDEYFVDAVRTEWHDLQAKLPAFQEKMHKVATDISTEQAQNFQRWDILNWNVSVGLVHFGSWQKEVEYVENFFADRIKYVEDFLSSN